MPQKRLFGVSLLQTVSRRYYFRARFPVVLRKSVFRRIFFVEIHFFLQCKKPYTRKKRRVLFMHGKNDDRNCRFQKLRILLKLGKNKKQKNQLSKRSSNKYSLLHTGF